ncbi:MAG: hypothetical protein NXI31_21905 [bacterium]|nr:hypothetical protein [bacterium]
MTTIAWVLALDADLELGDPEGYRPSARAQERSAAWARRFLASANRLAPLGVRHQAVDAVASRAASRSDEVLVQAWCPTPRSRAVAERARLPWLAAPPLTTLQDANHRAFACSLPRRPASGIPAGLPGREFVRTMAALDAILAGEPPADGWLLKRPFGFSGRDRKRVAAPLPGSGPRAADRRWAEASMTSHGVGLLVEPFVDITLEVARHAWLDRGGEPLIGGTTELAADEGGAWIDNVELTNGLDDSERAALDAAVHEAASQLHMIGYFGPFGIDAYRYRDASGTEHFEPLGELNARYSMGWFTGMGSRQPEWIARLRRLAERQV